MKRLQTLVPLLTVTFLLAACGGSGQSGQAPEPESGNTEPAAEQSVPSETTPEANESATPETTEGTSPERERAGQGQESGYSVTTLDGKQVSLGGDDATAIFFMAGW